MLGYFDILRHGELSHSALARTARISGLSSHYDMPLAALGRHTRDFGLHFPKHGHALLANIPKGLSYDAHTLLTHSLFPTVAPFLAHEQRRKLEDSIVDGVSRGLLCRDSMGPLRYCPGCAAKDLLEHHTVHWHVLPQHPGTTACFSCKCQLVDTSASLGKQRRLLYAPDWIESGAPTIPASETELSLAQDLEWLAIHNNARPGGHALAKALRNILQSNTTYGRGTKTIKLPRLVDDIRSRYSEGLLKRIGLGSAWRISYAISPNVPSVEFQAYSVIAHTVGTSLPEIFSLATKMNQRISVSLALPTVPEKRLSWAKLNIQQFLRQTPDAGLRALCQLRPRALAVVRRHDPNWCSENLPKRRHRYPKTSPNTVDWPSRDIEWAQQIEKAKARLLERDTTRAPRRIVRRSVLEEWGLKKGLTKDELANLPLTRKALIEALDSRSSYINRRAEWAIVHFIKTKRNLGLRCFVDLGNMRNDCQKCPTALAIATEAWRRYRDLIGQPSVTSIGANQSAA